MSYRDGTLAQHTKVAVVFIAVVAGITAYTAREHRRSVIEQACNANLQTLFAGFTQYAKVFPDRYPRLSKQPGRLMFDVDAMYPNIDPTALISPLAPDASAQREAAVREPAAAFTDRSYWYLGYAMVRERSGLAWVAAYKENVTQSTPIQDIYEVWLDHRPVMEARQKAYAEECVRRKQRPPQIHKQDGETWNRYLTDFSTDYDEICFYYHLGEGVDRLLIREPGYPVGGKDYKALIPVVIERPELHGDGGHVLYLDGHVEFVPYPGRFPMTEKFVEGLRALDALEYAR